MDTSINIVINFNKCTKTSITASNRIAKWISNLLNYRLVDDKKLATYVLEHSVGNVIIINGMYGFCDFKDEVKEIILRANKVIWIGNDYAIEIPSQIRFIKIQRNFYRIAQYSNFDNLDNHIIVDFNKLTFDKTIRKMKYKYEGLFYYGALRKDRVQKFSGYLKNNSNLKVTISTSKKNQKEFYNINNSAVFVNPIPNVIDGMQYFQSSVYIEDVINKKIELTPANRFYECLSAKILLLYDTDSKQTLERAGFWNDNFAVTNQEDVIDKLKNYDELVTLQQELFNNGTQDYKLELEKDFLIAINSII